MRLAEAKSIIYAGMKPKGFRVCFEHADGRVLRSDYFPDRGEPLIEHEEEAWDLAHKFAKTTTGKCVNIFVVDDRYCPVAGYEHRKIENR